MSKPVKTVRRTVLVVVPKDVPVSRRVLQWEAASRTRNRKVHRVELATEGVKLSGRKPGGQQLYLLDLELTCRGANRHDLSKFVQSYLPEARQHFITE